MKIVAVMDEYMNLAFQIIGIQTYHITSIGEKFEEEFDQILENEDIGIIIIKEQMLMQNKNYFKVIKNRDLPIIVEIPDILNPLDEKYFQNFLKTYIGFNE